MTVLLFNGLAVPAAGGWRWTAPAPYTSNTDFNNHGDVKQSSRATVRRLNYPEGPVDTRCIYAPTVGGNNRVVKLVAGSRPRPCCCSVNDPDGAADDSGNVYVTDTDNNSCR